MGRVDHYTEDSGTYEFEGFVRLDTLKMSTFRSTYTLLSWFALVGGSLKGIKSLCAYFVTTYVSRDFMNNVLGSMFMVKKLDPKKGDVPDTQLNAIKNMGKSVTNTPTMNDRLKT